jgi:hypothetical protein
MPISPIVLQRRHAELGRIRLGAKEATSNGRTRPAKLAAFRFTSVSQRYIEDLATLYGGDPKPWDNNGIPSWEVYTTATSIPVIAVKGGLSQWMETWSGGGCVHRCDGQTNTLTDSPCDPDDQTHRDAKPTTRLSVMLPELEAIGVWRMESHGWNAAAEIPAVAELAQYVGDLVPANLNLVERRSVKDGKTSRFVVPVLDLQIGTARLKEIVAEKSGAGVALEGGVQERPAIEAGPSSGAALNLPTLDDIKGASSRDVVTNIWRFLKSHDALTPELEAACVDRAAQLQAAERQQPAAEEVAEGEIVGDTGDEDAIWQQILKAAGERGMTTSQLDEDFKAKVGTAASAAAAGELQAYLEQLRTAEAVSA